MSEIKEEKTVTKESVVGHKCDNCGKVEKDYGVYDKNWLHFSESHSGWGNDSIESFRYYDVCSAECFKAVLPRTIKNVDGHQGAEVADMPVNFVKKLLEALK